MALFKRAVVQAATITNQLTNASEALRTRADQAAEAAESYRALADDSAARHSLATKQAAAVEQALTIVSAAGVTL